MKRPFRTALLTGAVLLAGQAGKAQTVAQSSDAAAQQVGESSERLQASLRKLEQLVQENYERLKQRDTLIQSLQRRVQALERGAGQPSQPSASPSAVAQQLPAASPELQGPSLKRTTSEVKVSPPPPGTPPGHGEFSVDALAAERALERALVQQGYALLPEGTFELEPSFIYSRLESSFPGFVASGGTLTSANNQVRWNSYLATLTARVGLPWSSQFDIAIPYRYLDEHNTVSVGGVGRSTTNTGGGGLSDIQVSLSKTLVQAQGGWPNIIGSIQYGANTGVTTNGVPLGLGYKVLRGVLAFSKQYDPLVFFGQVGYGYGFAAHGFNPGSEYAFQMGTLLSVAPEASLRFLLDQRFFDYGQRNGLRAVSSGQTLSTFVTGASIVIGPRTLLDISVGIGLTSDTPRYYFRIGLPFRFM